MTPTTIERLKQTDEFRLSATAREVYVFCNYNGITNEYESVLKKDYTKALNLKRGRRVVKL